MLSKINLKLNLKHIAMREILPFIISFNILIFLTVSLNAEPLEINVKEIYYDKLPRLSSDQIKNILNFASNTIKNAYNKDVIFTFGKSDTIENYISMHREKIAPYEIPQYHYYNIFNDSFDRFEEHIINNCKKHGSIDAIKKLIPKEYRKQIDNYESIKDILLKIYSEKLNSIKNIKVKDDVNLINKDNWKYFSFRHWFNYISSEDYKNNYNLYLANIIIIDDDLFWAPPHTLIRGGITNGTANFGSKTVIIAYYPILSENKNIQKYKDGHLTDEEKIKAIGYIAAHEIGTHLLMGFEDNYSHKQCIAKPCVGLRYKSYINNFKKLTPCSLHHETLHIETLKFNKSIIRIDIFWAQKKWKDIINEGNVALKFKVKEKRKAEVYDKIGWAYYMSGDLFESWEYFHKATLSNSEYENYYIKNFGLKDRSELPWNSME